MLRLIGANASARASASKQWTQSGQRTFNFTIFGSRVMELRNGRARNEIASKQAVCVSVLDLPTALEEPVAHRPERDVQHQQPQPTDQKRRVARPEKARAEA